MSPLHLDYTETLPGFPRVSGDEPGTLASEIRRLVFSPRERG